MTMAGLATAQLAAPMARADVIGSTIRLYIAGKSTGILLRTDPAWPTMWRIHHADRVSDMVNLARAKDAAIAWARPRGLGGNEAIRWDRRETALEAPLMRPTAGGTA